MANPDIQRAMHRNRATQRPPSERVLEVGGYVGEKSLLRFRLLRRAERSCINLVEQPDGTGIKHVVGSSNDMHMFKDTLRPGDVVRGARARPEVLALGGREHRCSVPGACWSICVPGFDKQPTDDGPLTKTFHVHYRFDYYRFSRRAVRSTRGLRPGQGGRVLDPPRIIGHGFKPINRSAAGHPDGPPEVSRRSRAARPSGPA